jgi:hypothetical protein
MLRGDRAPEFEWEPDHRSIVRATGRQVLLAVASSPSALPQELTLWPRWLAPTYRSGPHHRSGGSVSFAHKRTVT